MCIYMYVRVYLYHNVHVMFAPVYVCITVCTCECKEGCVRRVRSKGYFASYLTSDNLVRPVPSVLSVGWVCALILDEKEEGVIFVIVNVKNVRSRGYLASYFSSVSQTRPARPL